MPPFTPFQSLLTTHLFQEISKKKPLACFQFELTWFCSMQPNGMDNPGQGWDMQGGSPFLPLHKFIAENAPSETIFKHCHFGRGEFSILNPHQVGRRGKFPLLAYYGPCWCCPLHHCLFLTTKSACTWQHRWHEV